MNLNILQKEISMPITIITLIALMVFNSNIHIPCLPHIRNEFLTSSFLVQFAFALNPLVSVFANFIFGSAAEAYNKKSLLIACIICFLTGCILCAYSPTIFIFLLGRLFQAIGDGGIAVVSIMILSIQQKEQFAYYLGINSAFCGLAWGLAPLFGSSILHLLGWQWNFFIIFCFVLVTGVLLAFYLPSENLERVSNKVSSIDSIWRTTIKLLNTTNFVSPNWGGAIAIGIFGAFEVNSPFIFIDSYNFTPGQFSLFNALIIAINVIASICYIKIVQYFKVKGALLIGIMNYLLFAFVIALSLSHLLLPSPYLILLIMGFLAFALPFLLSTTTIYALHGIEEIKGIALATLTCSRNLASATITLVTSIFYTGDIYPFFTISLAVSIIALRFLFITLKRPL